MIRKEIKEEDKKSLSPTQHAKGAGGDPAQKKLKAITNDFFEEKKEQLLDKAKTNLSLIHI